MAKSIVSEGSASSPRVAAILGTDRPGNYTRHALAIVLHELAQQPELGVTLLDPSGMRLPFPGHQVSNPSTEELKEEVGRADLVLMATPEYHGCFSAKLKLIIENLGFPSVLRNKPVGLLGVAAGRIGAIKSLEHLRGVCSHVGALVLPGSVSVPRVRSVFDEEGNCSDEEVAKQLRQLAQTLVDYAERHLCVCPSGEEIARA